MFPCDVGERNPLVIKHFSGLKTSLQALHSKIRTYSLWTMEFVDQRALEGLRGHEPDFVRQRSCWLATDPSVRASLCLQCPTPYLHHYNWVLLHVDSYPILLVVSLEGHCAYQCIYCTMQRQASYGLGRHTQMGRRMAHMQTHGQIDRYVQEWIQTL